MTASLTGNPNSDLCPAGSPEKRIGESVPGWLGSLLLHLLFVVFLFALMRNGSQAPESLVRLVPVNIVRLGENTASPPQQLKSAVPQQKAAMQRLVRPGVPAAKAPVRKPAEADAMEAQLRALAKLREPQTNLPVLDNAGASNVDATSNDAETGARAAYSVRDYIRNQVERRWSIDFGRLGGRNYVVLIHVALNANGTITKAEIVDKTRFATDASYHDVALSARNAVLLSSPIALPSGQGEMPMEMTLRLSLKDTLR